MVDARDLKSLAFGRAGSSPAGGTKRKCGRVNRPKCAPDYRTLLSTQFATIRPGIAACTHSASRARCKRFASFACGTSRKIGTVLRPRPVFAREATPSPRLFKRPSATSRLGPRRRYTKRNLIPRRRSHSAGVMRPPFSPLPAAGVGIASQNPSFDRISGPASCAPTITGAFDQMRAAACKLSPDFG